MIVEEDFDNGFLPAAQWTVSATGNGGIWFPPNHTPSTIRLDTSSSSGGDSVTLRSNKQFSVNDGTLIFKAQVGAYHDGGIYGDRQPRGLAAGTDRSHAIEFITASPTAVLARTVSDGIATETFYDLGETLYLEGPYHFYQIVAKTDEVKFYVNGTLVAHHTTNVPTAALNVLFSTSDGGAGTTPIDVDHVSFEIAR